MVSTKLQALCAACGYQNHPSATVCEVCGARLTPAQRIPAYEPLANQEPARSKTEPPAVGSRPGDSPGGGSASQPTDGWTRWSALLVLVLSAVILLCTVAVVLSLKSLARPGKVLAPYARTETQAPTLRRVPIITPIPLSPRPASMSQYLPVVGLIALDGLAVFVLVRVMRGRGKARSRIDDRERAASSTEAARAVIDTAARQPRTITGEVRGFHQRTEGGSQGSAPVMVWTFRVERYDAEGNRLPPIPVEMRSGSFAGSINEGDSVEVPAAPPHGGTLVLTSLRNLTTGEVVGVRSKGIFVYILYVIIGIFFLFVIVNIVAGFFR